MRNFKEHVVVGSLAHLEVVPKLRRRVKDDMLVGRIGKQDIELFLPAFGLGNPAGGAKPGLAGKEHRFLRPALRAFPEMKTHCLSAAVEHFCNVFGDCRTGKQALVFAGKTLPVVKKYLFELFPSDDLHIGGRGVLSACFREKIKVKSYLTQNDTVFGNLPNRKSKHF